MADLLEVSRQSVSKWESDLSYPETDKLIKLGKLFDCSMDYLLNEEITQKNTEHSAKLSSYPERINSFLRKQCRERKSEKILCGMPLYHIGKNAHGFFAIGWNASGVFAVGLRSRGVVSLGLLSCGILSIGLLSLGLIAFGNFALGLLAVGTVALGLFAAGAISIGILSFGALSIGEFSAGALATGRYIAVGDYAKAKIAIGDSEAFGSVYQRIGEPSSEDLSYIKAWLDENVPVYFGWAKELFKRFLS